jgi:hypothetical protein
VRQLKTENDREMRELRSAFSWAAASESGMVVGLA